MSQSFAILFLMLCSLGAGVGVGLRWASWSKERTEVAFQKEWRHRAGEDMGGWR